MEQHKKRVEQLSRQVAGFYAAQKPFKIYHGSTNSTRVQVFKRDEMLDASKLNHVLQIDIDAQTALVEPNVPMDVLVESTLRHGLVPKVVMEFPGITAGGGVQGGAGESSSFRYGGFHAICNSYEIISGGGSVLTCSPAKHADLFYGTAGSYGTLGVMTALEVQLMPAKKYINLTYMPVSGFDDAVQMLQKVTTDSYDYIDGIMFGPDHGVIMVGTLSDEKISKAQRFTRARDDWFYLHAKKIDAAGKEHTESIPLVDYFFRYDRGGFWVGKYAFDVLGMRFNRFWRIVHDRLLHTRTMYQALQESGMSQQFIVQDLALPRKTAAEFMRYTDAELGIYPLWLCPLKRDESSPFISSNLKTDLVINVGLWGGLTPSYEEFLRLNRNIETKVTELGGKKWFYAHAYYDETSFWQIYDKRAYDKLRTAYKTGYQPNIYDKVRVRERHPIKMSAGVWRPFFGISKLKIVR